MKRSSVGLEAVADWHNLAAAFHRAACGKASRPEVRRFASRLNSELATLHADILDGTLDLGRMRSFSIRDPNPRLIPAPCFRERVLHHALMAHVGPVLDRTLIDDSYACREGKGTLAAVQRVQHHLRRWPRYVQIDVRGYFAAIDHQTLQGLLARRFKDPGLLALLWRIIDAHHSAPGKGLPIGALTSQHIANYYLAGLDRLLLEGCRRQVQGLVRYMDDLLWVGADRASLRGTLEQVRGYAAETLGLQVKQPVRLGRSADGANFCGHRILPGRLLLSRRRKRRYQAIRSHWERAFARGDIDSLALQRGYAAALGITVHADAVAWRREQLRRRPPPTVLLS